MVNRLQFLKDSHQLSISTLSLSRANLCEILAIRVLRESPTAASTPLRVAHSLIPGEWSERSLSLATLLLTPWALFQGASEAVIERAREEGDEDSPAELAGNALEVRSRRRCSASAVLADARFGPDGHFGQRKAIHPIAVGAKGHR